MYITPEAFKVWGAKGASSIVLEDARTLNNKVMCVNYIAAISVEFGAIYWEPVSGTRGPGYVPETQWQASASPLSCPCSINSPNH